MGWSGIGPLRENVGVTIDTNAVGPYLDSKTDSIRAALARKMTFTSAMLTQKAQEKVDGVLLKRRTSQLFESIRPMDTVASEDGIDGGAVAGGPVAPYARALEYGAKAHLIVAVNAKALKFSVAGGESMYSPWGGKFSSSESMDVYVKSVHHPGNRAYAFMRGTLDEEASNIQQGFRDAAAEAARA